MNFEKSEMEISLEKLKCTLLGREDAHFNVLQQRSVHRKLLKIPSVLC